MNGLKIKIDSEQMTFNIQKPDEGFRAPLLDRIDNLTKPKGSLGRLEELALRIGMIQQTLSPQLRKPCNLLFAADHGIVAEGVSYSPKEVTWQQIGNFLKGGAGINFLCRQHGFDLRIVDAGVDFDFPADCGVQDMKIRKGTSNYLYEPAMSAQELELGLERGAQAVQECWEQGCNVISFGEMGIGNTSSSSMWMHYFTGIPLHECVGAGSGLGTSGIAHKYQVLNRAAQRYEVKRRENAAAATVEAVEAVEAWPMMALAKEIMAEFGGFEMVMAVGGMLRAAELHMVILVDGFIMTNCILAAKQLYPNVMEYAIFGHTGDETGHKRVLDAMGVEPLLSLGLRLGEGSGAICAYPIVDSSVRMLNEMETFAGAAVTKYF